MEQTNKVFVDEAVVATSPREIPERIVLPVQAGLIPSDEEPVRIFIGTEPAQYRAERVLLWSIEKFRDPSRVYEIYLMKELDGFDRRKWLTGFTNYRFAVPHFAGATGRAIYNDVDQVYLSDPAELFDLDLGEHGYLAISPRDTSVMVMDCARMIDNWPIGAVRKWRKNKLIDQALAVEGVAGPLGGEWNARDHEHVNGRSKCVHFTTLHKQPWRPFPERFFYQDNPAGEVFLGLEREANEAGYNVFSVQCPSIRYQAVSQDLRDQASRHLFDEKEFDAAVRKLTERSGAVSLLELTPDDAPLEDCDPARTGSVSRARMGLLTVIEPLAGIQVYDGVICTAGLEQLPSDDIPWVLDELFRHVSRFVFVAVRHPPGQQRGGERRPLGTVWQAEWWATLLHNAAQRRPGVHWQLAVAQGAKFDGCPVEYHQGGCFLGSADPVVWVLEDHKPGHSTQSIGLVEELGWPYRRIQLQFNASADRAHFLRGPTLRGLTLECARGLCGPWPDLLVASGARTMPVAEWIRAQSQGQTRTVYLGRKGAYVRNHFDLAVAPSYVGLYPEPRRIETLAPLTRVRREELELAAQQWRDPLGNSPRPHIALLVGGDDSVHQLTAALARQMGEEVAAMVRATGGSLWVTTSRRTSSEAAAALRGALGDCVAYFHRWTPQDQPQDNPYMGFLALADTLVATGESASMLAEACSTGKPVHIYPLEKRTRGLQMWKRQLGQGVAHRVMARAFSRPVNRRGFERPQRRMELFCAQLVANGWVRPQRDICQLHQALVEQGLACYFDGTYRVESSRPLNEVAQVAERVRALLGVNSFTRE
jgi:mitochondrial fission protein ELM1